ncbi:hypothetical protein EV182_006398 [Spiromyces aspiralis]|uniref:Uncharacterized protein n=1 Tax=Spiromyces aspiralis TaxID=68401 RepID=A0ACC1HBU0_9FUNG|nr:hypothetical protein EV182_006398 [Spiromyces aspiralis]
MGGGAPHIDDRKVRAVEAIANAAFDGGLEDYLTAKERALLEKPYQTWGQDDFDQGMHWESFGVLQWLLGRQHKIPHYFANFDRASLFQATGVMPANPSTIDAFVNSYMSAQAHHLLDTSRLRHEVAVAEAWNWRARVQVVMDLRDQILEEAAAKAGRKLEQGPPEEEDEARVVDRIMAEKRVPRSLRRMVRDLDQVVRTATGRAIERSLIENSADDDFGITVELKPEEVRAGGQRETVLPYSKLDSKVHDSLRRISEARLFAFAWAVSKLEDWDIEHMAELGSIGPIGSIWAPDDDHGDSP